MNNELHWKETGKVGASNRQNYCCSSQSKIKIADDRSVVLKSNSGRQYNRIDLPKNQRHAREKDYLEPVYELCLRTVAIGLGVSLEGLRAKSRSDADTAFARQVAMHLFHTQFGVLMTDVGICFKRDRTTVAHACALVEDKRDCADFDRVLESLECLLQNAVHAIEFAQRNHVFFNSGSSRA